MLLDLLDGLLRMDVREWSPNGRGAGHVIVGFGGWRWPWVGDRVTSLLVRYHYHIFT
jgi:hypothetical protein